MMSITAHMLASLTLSERAAAQMLKSGYSQKRIASSLGVTMDEVDQMIDHISYAQSQFVARRISDATAELGRRCRDYWLRRNMHQEVGSRS